ncbi:MAG: MFS transporter [Rhodospirillales bacterium]|nr:MFS transporter [Rhodospirillales bacterium]
MALLPAIAPLAGGALLGAFGWRANFVVMTVFGVMATLLTAAKLSETLRHPDPQAANPTRILSNFIRMLQHPQYLGCALAGACAFCGLFAFISGSSFVLIGVFGVSEQNFGFYFGAPVIGYMIGTQIGGRMTRNYGITTILSVGTACLALAGALIAALAIIRVDHPIAVVAPMAFYMIAVGLVLPQTLAGALTPFPDRAGTASSLLGFIQMSLGAVVGALVAHLHDGTQVPMAAAIGVMGGLSFLMFQFVVKPAFRKTAA